jgi:hypothetical protein
VFVAILLGGPPRLWLWLGVIVGAGLMNKYSMLFFAAGAGVGPVARWAVAGSPHLGALDRSSDRDRDISCRT